MSYNQAESTAALRSPKSSTWVHTVSSVTVLTVGLQGAAASAVSTPVVPLSEPGEEFAAEATAEVTAASVAPVEPAAVQPRFSQLRAQVQQVLQSNRQPPVANQAIARLENHQRALYRHANTVESQLLSIQDLLSIQAYGTSFADQLLEQNDAYQSKLQQLQTLETDIHVALEQADADSLDQLNHRLQFLDQQLRQMAQQMLTDHMEQAQRPSTFALWQEPIYRESLRWLMDYTHERHLLQVRQQTLARTLVAMAAD